MRVLRSFHGAAVVCIAPALRGGAGIAPALRGGAGIAPALRGGAVFCSLLLVLAACDEPAQPRRPPPDAAVDAGGVGGSAGSSGSGGGAGAGSGGSSGRGGTGGQPCEAAAPPIEPDVLPAAVLGQLYAQPLKIVGATAPSVSWRADMLPPGLILAEDDTVITTPQAQAQARLGGTPTAAGTFTFEVTVSFVAAMACVSPPARKTYELIVSDPDADAGTR